MNAVISFVSTKLFLHFKVRHKPFFFYFILTFTISNNKKSAAELIFAVRFGLPECRRRPPEVRTQAQQYPPSP
jgi:hypothetical protein